MTFFRGRLPSHILVMASLFSFAAQAQHNTPLTLAEAEDLALDQEPGHAALLAQASALKERSVVAGQLPDPMLQLGLNNFPIEAGGFSTEGMTHALVGLRQVFPRGDTRKLSTRQFQSFANEMAENADVRGLDVLTAARHSWLEAYYWDQAHAMVAESQPFFRDLAIITRSLYAVGRKNQQDVLRAELELGRLDDRLIEIERWRATAKAALSEWVGSNASRPVASTLPAWDELPKLNVLQANLMRHPTVGAADARIAAREVGVDLANERSKAGWTLDLGYSYREGSLPGGDPRSDFISLSVSVDLPFFRKKSIDGTLSAALQERRAARESRKQQLRRLQSQLDAEYARWQQLTRRLDLYEQRILGQARDNAEASLLAYQSDTSDFADVMRGYIDDLNTRLDYSRLRVEHAQSYAVLANLGGIPR